jgi:hypothetical protein
MATILLDTSVIFDHLNGRYGRTAFLDQLIEQGHVLACCPVNFTEVYAGIRPGEERPQMSGCPQPSLAALPADHS